MQLPNADSPTPPQIQDSPKFFPFFDCTLGAIDGTHIQCHESATDYDATRVYSLKTALLHVPLIFILCIFYLVGRDQQQTLHFSIRPVKVTSTSQGGGITSQMLALPCQMCCWSPITMCGTIYLNGIVPRKCKWYVFSQKFLTDVLSSPHNPQELFNLHHVSACNVIEWIFGILKQHF